MISLERLWKTGGIPVCGIRMTSPGEVEYGAGIGSFIL